MYMYTSFTKTMATAYVYDYIISLVENIISYVHSLAAAAMSFFQCFLNHV